MSPHTHSISRRHLAAGAAWTVPAIAVAASGAATRNESLFIRIDAPLREVVVIPAPLA